MNVKNEADRLFSRYAHYYVREGNHPIGTIFIGKRRGSRRICRGIAICSTIENFNYAEGTSRAMARMVAAAERRMSDLKILGTDEREAAGRRTGAPAKAVDRFDEAVMYGEANQFTWKSEYNATPTPKEVKLLTTIRDEMRKNVSE